MDYRVRFTRRARRDFEQLGNSINAPQSAAAVRWLTRMRDTIALLSTAPRMGTVMHEDPDVRHIIFGKKPHLYRILYEVDDRSQQVKVLSIWHGKRLPPDSFRL